MTRSGGQLRGRADPLAVAFTALATARGQGEGAVLLVTGDPGIGKTAFLEAVAEQARRRGFTIGTGVADETNAVVPGAPVLLALRSGREPLVDRVDFARLSPSSMQPLWLAEEIADLVERRARERPVLIVLDDLQWADRLTRFLLRVLTGRLSGAPVVWIVACRPDSATQRDLLESAHTLEGVRLHRIELGPLPPAELLQVAADVLGSVPDRLSRWLSRTDGNPFLAVQLAEAVAREPADAGADPELPASFTERVHRDLAQLGTATRRMLECAAVWGSPFAVPGIAAVLGATREDVDGQVDQAVQAGLLLPSGSSYRFRHDLLRDVVDRSTAVADRMRWHSRIAVELMDGGHPAIEAAAHAAHGIGAGDRRSLEILQRAAGEALAAHPSIAADLMQQAFSALPVDSPGWAETGEQYANALWHAQRGSEAVRVIDVLIARSPARHDTARLQVLAAHALWLTGQPGNILERTEPRLAAPLADPVLQARLDASRALALSRVGTPDAAVAVADAVLVDARRLADTGAEMIALQALGEVARNQGNHLRAYGYFHRLRVDFGADFLALEITALQHLDRFDEADLLLGQEAQRRSGRPDSQLPGLASAQLWQHFNRGRFEEADAAARSLIRLGNELGNYVHRLDARVAGAVCALIRGDLEPAAAIVLQAEAERKDSTGGPSPALLLVRARIASAAGDAAGARALLREMDTEDTAAHLYWSRSLAQLRFRVGVALTCEDEGMAEATRERAMLAADKNPGVASYRGTALQVAGLVHRDVGMLGEAADILAACPRPSMAATALADHGHALLAAGRRTEGVHRMEQAWTIFSAVGSVAAAAAAQDTLRRAGVRRNRARGSADRAHGGWASLTEAERRVTELVVAGHTNRSAADQLAVSVNTVGTHLNAVFSKLGVRSRLQLANALRERPVGLPGGHGSGPDPR